MSNPENENATTLMPATSESYDLVVLGAGPGGYIAAIRAAQLGGKVAIVEKQYIGGTCLNVGCIPSKALLHVAEEYSKFSHLGTLGILAQKPSFDMSAAVRYKAGVVKKLTSGVASLLKANGVTTVTGRGTVEDAGRVIVDEPGGKRRILSCNKLILATGSVTVRPPFPGIDGERVISSTEALELQKVPESLICIGGGVIAVELACLFNALGTKVTIIEMLPSMIAYEEPEIVGILEKTFRKRGIDIHLNTKVEAIADAHNMKAVSATGPNGQQTFSAEYVLVAVGRTANPDGLKALIDLGMAMERNKVLVNEKMETTIPNVYAIGDLSGKTQLAHVASAEGEVAAENAMGHEAHMDYSCIARPVYTFPEIASVGLTEAQAKEQDPGAHVGTFPWTANGKALAGDATEGTVKVIIGSYSEILGASIIGADATNLISEYALAMQSELTVAEIIKTIHPHPTLSEALHDAVLSAEKRPLHIYQRVR
jgi:dihydrolipoamide dehydrogenase